MVMERMYDEPKISDFEKHQVELELIENAGPLLSKRTEGFQPVGRIDPEIRDAIFEYNEKVRPGYKQHTAYKGQKHHRGSLVVKPLSEWEPLLVTIADKNHVVDMLEDDQVDEMVARLERSNEIMDQIKVFRNREDYEAINEAYDTYRLNGYSHQELADMAGEKRELIELVKYSRLTSSRQMMRQELAEDYDADLLVALRHVRDEDVHVVENLVNEAMVRAELMVLLETDKIS